MECINVPLALGKPVFKDTIKLYISDTGATVIVVPKIMLAQRTKDLTELGIKYTLLSYHNTLSACKEAKPGVYVISYYETKFMEGIRPFFDTIIFDEHYPDACPTPHIDRLVRVNTKLVVDYSYKWGRI